MRKIMVTFCVTFTIIMLASISQIYACTIEIPPMRKDFRNAKAVFVGEVIKIEDNLTGREIQSNIPKSLKDFPLSKVTFVINQNWKGDLNTEKTYFSVTAYSCGCPSSTIDLLEVGTEYLVFADKKNFLFVCSTEQTNSESAKDKIKRLNRFWFRSWATIYPF